MHFDSTLLAYNFAVKAVFVELPPFERHRAGYLGDDAFRALQELLMQHPEAGDLMPDTGGLRKLRFADAPPQGDFLRGAPWQG